MLPGTHYAFLATAYLLCQKHIVRVPTAQPAVGVAIAVLNKMVDDTDNQKKVENAENETALCSTRYNRLILKLLYDGRTDRRRTEPIRSRAYAARGASFSLVPRP